MDSTLLVVECVDYVLKNTHLPLFSLRTQVK